LNIKLSSSEYKRKTLIEKAEVREIVPVEGFKKGLCLSKVSINGVNCAIIIPEVPDYPEDMLEIIAPINLRKKLGLKDGDTVEVKVSMK
jgi:riboflavin kinase